MSVCPEPQFSASDDLLRRAVMQSPDTILAVGPGGSVHAYHRGLTDGGIRAEEPAGLALPELLPTAAAHVLQHGVEEALRSGRLKVVVYALDSEAPPVSARGADGGTPCDRAGAEDLGPRYVEARIMPGEDAVALCYLREITEERRNQQALIRQDLTYGALMQIYHRLLTATPDDPPVSSDVLAMLGYAAGAGVTYYVPLSDDGAPENADDAGLLWTSSDGTSDPVSEDGNADMVEPLPDGTLATARDYLARCPLPSWLPTLRRGRPVQSTASDRDDADVSLVIPVLVHDELVGILGFEAARRVPWPDEEVALLGAAATAIAFHEERARHLMQIEAHAEEIAQMNVDLVRARDLARASDRAKSDFLAVMGHELRTPLNPVISMTEMLLGTRLSEEQREYAEMAHDAGMVLLQQINAILDYVEIETGSPELQTQPLDPAALLAQVADLYREPAREKGLGWLTLCHPDTPRQLAGDPQRLQLVLGRLVDNALKFTKRGKIVVRVEPVHSVAPGASRAVLRFSVSDTGIGLPADAESWLFKPFTQADATITRTYGGTGLGLATAQRWVSAMGGEIGARRNPARGSSFWFTVPLALAVGEEEPVAPVAVEPGRSLRGLRVLVVDDLESNCEILTSYLRTWEVDVRATTDPRESVSLLQHAQAAREPYDVAILDLLMPGIDGIALATAIQQREVSPDTRLVLLTAYDAPRQRQVAQHTGFCAYLTKPLGRAQLHDVLIRVVATMEPPACITLVEAETRLPDDAASRPMALLIEENTILRRLGARELERVGFDVIPAAGLAAAMRALANHGDVALVLIDVLRHGADVARLVQQIRERSGGTGMGIVGMTAQAGDGREAAHGREGADGHGSLDGCVPKPLMPAAAQELYARWGIPPEEIWPLASGASPK